MKRLDLIVIAVVAALSLAPLAFFGRGAAAAVRVTQHGELIYEGRLTEDVVIETDGCTVVVEDGRAYVGRADCPDGLCQKGGAATALHPVVCLPNELVITVTEAEEAPDAITY